ncbi:MAG: hypothetical protein HC902_09355 [Calothrix sp. SM1_5_4]|nr:hypothetical protein [Calothrix sp. SM1_5_4]
MPPALLPTLPPTVSLATSSGGWPTVTGIMPLLEPQVPGGELEFGADFHDAA